MKTNATPFSTLTDEEFVQHLLEKKAPTDEDVEAAIRLQQLLESYSALLEDIHREAGAAQSSLQRIQKMVARV